MRASPFGLSRDNSLIVLSMLFWGGGEGLWLYIQPLYVKSLGANSLEIGFVLSVAPVLMLFTFIPVGIIADRYSRKRVMVAGYAAGAVAVSLLGLARDWRQSIVGFVLYYGSAACLPAIYAYVAHATEARHLNRAFSIVYAGYALGLTIFPTLGGWLGQVAGFRMVFALSAFFLALSTLSVALVADQPVSPAAPRFGFHEVLVNRRLLLISALFIPTFLALYLGQPFAPNYLQEVVKVELFKIGFLGSLHALGATIIGIWLGRLTEGGWSFMIGQGLVVVSLVVFLGTQAMPLLMLSFFLRGAYNACRSLAMAQTGRVLSSGSAGLSFGIFNTAYNISAVVAPFLAGWLYISRPDLPFLVSAATIPVTMVLFWALVRGERV
jgi:MFS family permease